MVTHFDPYLKKLRAIPLDDQTEHTGRSALEELLNSFAAEADGGKIIVQHEPKRESGHGAPDFKVTRKGMILGYVENKGIGEPLDKVLKSDQIKRYRELSPNILLTDYLEWIWLDEKSIRGRATLAYPNELEGKTIRVAPERAEAVGKLIAGFFSTAPQGIWRSQQLALALATRSRLLHDYLGEELVRQAREHTEGRLYGLYQIFRDQIFHELKLDEFADAFAQMLAYGLFLARLNSGTETVTLDNARQFVPGSFRLIRELVEFLTVLNNPEYREVRWVVEEVLSIVNGLDLNAIHEDLSFRQRKAISRKVRAGDEEEHRLFERDPFIYFYEDYLKEYDPATKKSRGVYYTPPPIVNFIVRAVDDILKDSFGIADGLADHRRVTVLDFACGTGTFLLEVFQRIFENIGGAQSGRAGLVVREHILKNIFGFEYLIAPYTIAHLKLSQYLAEQGHPLGEGERLQVFLTNTLEPVEPQENFLLPAITAEVEAAQKVKDRQILVITGNPPYSGHSKNKGEWIARAIDGYKYTVETDAAGNEIRKPLGERNPKWLNDDYVKFIRFAQMKMDAVPEGIVGIITNHSWLDNPTFRGMRQSLMRSFEQIYVLDLHGSTNPKESPPNGMQDENVFDIKKGVAITLFVKKSGIERGVWLGDVWGKRLAKYGLLASSGQDTLDWTGLSPRGPQFAFDRHDAGIESSYRQGLSLPDIFGIESVGLMTARDALSIQFSRLELLTTVRDFAILPVEKAREKYNLRQDVRDWHVEWAQADVRETNLSDSNAASILYRPFDVRWTYYTGRSRGFHCYPRTVASNLMIGRSNIALLSARSNKSPEANHFLVTDLLSEAKTAESTTQSYFFPLRGEQTENLSPDFRAFLDARYEHHYTPEEILGFIYAVLHAPAYRTRYAEFLRIDFPRVPFPDKAEDFDLLSDLGWALVQAHLLRELPRRKLAQYPAQGSNEVEKVTYALADQAVFINKTQFFKPVPQAVWEFHIGGYQVLDKYLKSRKGRTLTLDEINHVSAVADSLAFTIEQMARIDTSYQAAFPEQGKSAA